MLRVVVDTNVIISALLFGGKPANILELARKKLIINIISEYIFMELQEVLVNKFFWQPKIAQETEAWVKSFSEVVYPEKHLAVISHSADNRILECGLEGNVDFIITGDNHLKNLKIFQGISIKDPAAFIDFIGERL